MVKVGLKWDAHFCRGKSSVLTPQSISASLHIGVYVDLFKLLITDKLCMN